MSLADVLLLGVVGVLVCYAALVVVAFRRTRDPGSTLILAFGAYWTLVGALYFLVAKRRAGGSVYTYLEDRLFPVNIDSVYALTLLAYAVFLLVMVCGFIALSRQHRQGGAAALSAWERLSQTFVHPRMLALVALLTVPKIYVVRGLIAGNADAGSLYEATRTVKGAMASQLHLYQYLNLATAYPLTIGFALWLGFQSGRKSYRPTHRALIWAVYGVLLAEVIGENALLGNRAVPLVVMAGLAAGWARWRYLPSQGRARSGLTLLLVGLGIAGFLGLGAIGDARGGNLTSPTAIGASLVSNLKDPANIAVQIGKSAEKVAAHMSLVGVIKDGPGLRQPFAANSYEVYTTLVNAPADQVFTIHPVAAWWLRVGPAGIVLAGLLLAVAVAFFQRLAFRPRGAVFSAFALPAAVLPAAGLPIIMLRSGPESLRALVMELLIIPALICLPAIVFGRSPQLATPDAYPAPLSTPTGARSMSTPLTSDATRAFDAVRRSWWIPVLAALLGAVIGFATSSSDGTSTYQAKITTPSVTASGDVNPDNPQESLVPADQLAVALKSQEVRERLGAVVDGATLVATVTEKPSAVDLRVTAPTAARAKAATAAYAQALVDEYDAYIAQQAQERLNSVTKGIEAIGQNPGDQSVATLAGLKTEQAYLQELVNRKSTAPPATELTSGSSSGLSTSILLMIAFGGLAAAVVGFLGLGSRTLRYTDDVTGVTGADSLVASVSGSGNWAVGNLVTRLAGETGEVVTLVPVGKKGIDDLRDTLLVGVHDASRVRISPPVGETGAESPAGPVLLIARLGTDNRSQLDSTYRAFSAANPHFVGVVTVDPGA
ncbi:hypothetical protein [Marmoricola sp. RAF53]|uniref:hypothetical protein n=1 Tax=Marmoricola sp. RAF53 TaxID=3233059 RepID=UPI003F990EFA